MTPPGSRPLVKLNVLGGLEIAREPDGGTMPLPRSTRACILLALFAVRNTYERHELVRVLWPGDMLLYDEPGSRKSIDERLNQVLSQARQAVGLNAESGFLYSRQGIVRRARDETISVTSDCDHFNELRSSPAEDDWRAALALIRGEIGAYLPRDKSLDLEWLIQARQGQRTDIATILQRLQPDATTEELTNLTNDILHGRSLKQESTSTPVTAAQSPTIDNITIPLPDPTPNPKTSIAAGWRRRIKLYGSIAMLIGSLIVVIQRELDSHHSSIPPEGYIVNALTGRAHMPHGNRLESTTTAIKGGRIVTICHEAARSPCSYLDHTAITAHLGDAVEIWIALDDPGPTDIPFIKISVDETQPMTVRTNEIDVATIIQWPKPPRGIGILRSVDHVHIRLATAGNYALGYIPSSTKLIGPSQSLEFQLPDGIMEKGVNLEDVGPPATCLNQCGYQYNRIVRFQAQVIAI